MRIKSLHLRNFCQHRSFDVDFPVSGVTIIQGPNGSGKSNIVRALHFALFGVTVNTSKGLSLTWGETSGYVELVFESNGVEGTLRRYVESAKTKLTFGGSTYNAAKAANEEMEKILGATLRNADKFVIAHQGRCTDILTAKPAERAKLIHRLFGTDELENVYAALGIEGSQILLTTSSDDREALVRQLAELRADTAKLQEETARNAAIIAGRDVSDLTNQLKEAEDCYRSYHDSVFGYEVTLKKISQTTERLKTVEKAESELVTFVAKRCYELKNAKPDFEAAQYRLQEAQRIDSEIKTRNLNKANLDELNVKLAVLIPCEPVREEESAHLSTKQQDLQVKVAAINAHREMYEQFKDGICPTCGTTKVTDSHGHEHPVKLRELDPAQLAEVERLQLECDEYRRELAAKHHRHLNYTKAKSELENSIAIITDRLSNLPVHENIENSISADRAIVTNYTLATVEFNEKNHAHSIMLNDKTTLMSQLSEQKKNLKRYESMGEKATQGYVQKLRNEVQRIVEAQNVLSLNEKLLFRNSRDEEAIATRIQAVDELERKNANRSKYKSLIDSARSVFHRDALPKLLAQQLLGTINSTWNEMLAVLDVPFSVSVDPDLGIEVKFPDSSALIEQASGGQVCCASLAFLIAVNRLFASEVGLLVLDEPTYGLDSDHLDRVSELLQEAQKYAVNAGMQIIVVTHEDRLRSGFESVVTL